MPDIHTIRLREPWTCEVVDGRAVWRRNFNWPAGLTAREVVWLVIDELSPAATVEVNGERSVAQSQGRFDITRLIREDNRVAVTSDAFNDICPFVARLEIDEG